MSFFSIDPEGTTGEGFILAGGHSSRMGRDKSLLLLGGKPLIQHAADNLAAAGLRVRIAGTRSDLSSFAPIIEDDVNPCGLGPLSGICAALAEATTRFAVFLPVDLPLMPGRLIAYLLEYAAITNSAIVTASVAGFVQTFPVVIDCAALPMLRSSLLSNDRNCLRAFRGAANVLNRPFSALPVEKLLQAGQVAHPQGLAPALWFSNINSPQDLSRAECLSGRRFQVS